MDKSFVDDIFNINPLYSTLIGTVIGFALIDDLTVAEQNSLGNWLILVGQVVLTNAASQSVIENRLSGNVININSKQHKRIYFPPKYDIQKIREIIKQTNPKHSNNAINLLEKSISTILEEIEKIKKG